MSRRARPRAWAAALVASVAQLALGFGAQTVAHASLAPAPTWTARTPASISANLLQPYAGTAVGDLFADGRKEVVAGFPDGTVHAWFADGSAVPGWPRFVGGQVDGSPTLADLAGNGRLEVIVASGNGGVYVFTADGRDFGNGWPQFTQHGSLTIFGSVAVGDLFGDGNLELVAASWDRYLYAWDAHGHTLPGFPKLLWDSVWDTPLLVDLEHTGGLDIVIGSDSAGLAYREPYPQGGVYWAFRADGSAIPGWPKLTDQVPWASPAAASLNGDGVWDVVAGSGIFFPQPGFLPCGTCGHQVNVWRDDGAAVPGWPQAAPDRVFSSPAVGDLLGDGRREVVSVSVDGTVDVWGPNGAALPGWPQKPYGLNGIGSPSIAPVDGSGRNGIWVPGQHRLYGFAASGTLLVDIPLSGTPYAAPTVADLGDGHLSVAITAMGDDSNSWWKVAVYPISGATTMPAGAWPTFHGSVLRSGTGTPTGRMPALTVVRYPSGLFTVFGRGADGQVDSASQMANGTWTPFVNLGGAPWTGVAAAINKSGTVSGFYIGADERLHSATQLPNGTWTPWADLGGVLSGQPVAFAYPNGLFTAFARGAGRTVNSASQKPDGTWTPWANLGGAPASDIAALINGSGTVSAFYIGADGHLHSATQMSNGVWTPWVDLGGALKGQPVAFAYPNGLFTAFARGAGGSVNSASQTPNGTWTPWVDLGGSPHSDVAALISDSGTVSAFYISSTRRLASASQMSNGVWTPWVDLGGNLNQRPTAVSYQNGLFSAFGIDHSTHSADSASQFPNGTWTPWVDLGGAF